MQPERMVYPPPWVGHIPFAFWIVEVMRPRRFVELGTHSGNSFGAFVQAATALSLEGEFYAVDHWQGDTHAGNYDDTVYHDVKRYFDARYPGRATLMRMSFDEAQPRFEDGSIDLLHIDGLHTYEAVKHDFENWLPKLSDRGVVLLHDTNVRENDFGVFRLLDELSARFQVFEFLHSHGLGIVQTGVKAAKPLKSLLKGETDRNEIAPRDYFARLGGTLVERAYLEMLLRRTEKKEMVKAALAAASQRKRELESTLEGLRAEAGGLIAGFNNQMRSDTYHGDHAKPLYEILSSGYFDTAGYLRQSGLRDHDGLSLAKHYLEVGEKAGIPPSEHFDPVFYRARYSDLAGLTSNLLLHFIRWGRNEGRLPKAPAP
jgi:hypothetical protein